MVAIKPKTPELKRARLLNPQPKPLSMEELKEKIKLLILTTNSTTWTMTLSMTATLRKAMRKCWGLTLCLVKKTG